MTSIDFNSIVFLRITECVEFAKIKKLIKKLHLEFLQLCYAYYATKWHVLNMQNKYLRLSTKKWKQ